MTGLLDVDMRALPKPQSISVEMVRDLPWLTVDLASVADGVAWGAALGIEVRETEASRRYRTCRQWSGRGSFGALRVHLVATESLLEYAGGAR